MDTQKKIEDVMTLCPHSVGLDQNIEVAKMLLQKHGFHHLPVLDGGRLLGIVSDRDVKFALGWSGSQVATLSVRDVYTPEPYIVEPTTPLLEVLRVMERDQIGCTLVAINKDKLVGIFTTTDACRCFADQLEHLTS